MGTSLKPRTRKSKQPVAANLSEDTDSSPEYYSKGIGRALDIIDIFNRSETKLNLIEIVKLSGIPETSLFRILLTLEHHGYLLRSEDGIYELTPKVLYGLQYEHSERLRQISHSFIQELSRRFNETVSLAYRFGDKIQVIDVMEAFHEVRATNILGKLLPPHCSSMAKAITAFQPDDLMSRIVQVYGLVKFTEKTIVDRLTLVSEYNEIRERGWSMEREESSVGICCFGAPIFNRHNQAIAAVSIMTPLMRLTPEIEEAMIRELLETAKNISESLNYEK